MLCRSRTFRLDCFASISKTDVSSETFVRARFVVKMRRSGRGSTTSCVPLGVSRIADQTRPLLIVSEHASGSWLASAEDSYHGNTGFLSSKYILAWSMLEITGIVWDVLTFLATLCIMTLHHHIRHCMAGSWNASFRMTRPQFSCKATSSHGRNVNF